MDSADLQSPEWRARAAARVSKKLLGFARGRPGKLPVLIVGMQRSGTTMLMNIFHLHPDADVFDEARSSTTFQDFRIRSLEVLKQSIDDSHYRFPCFKVIADSHILPSILRGLSMPKVLWMYREPGPNAASRLKKWGAQGTAAIRKVCAAEPGGGWFAEGVSELNRAARCAAWTGHNSAISTTPVWPGGRATSCISSSVSTATPPCACCATRHWSSSPSRPCARCSPGWAWSGRNPRCALCMPGRCGVPICPALDPQVASLCSELLQRLDEVHARQWQKLKSPGIRNRNGRCGSGARWSGRGMP